ncbi:MAG: Gfo/Idh/MocA family oxidoreductase [Verrucomicrobia bacterium]|nr:Gfo/Idh/MocA family oxidoreductase [Verrucomicrobiota bacterium]
MPKSKSARSSPSASPSAASAEKLKVAIIGTGGISGTHAKSVKACADLDMVGSCDIISEKAEKAAADRGGRAYTNAEEMLDKEKPDLVLLCTPQMARLDPIRFCAERRVPIFIEKPPADTLDRAHEIEAILKKHPVIHSVGFMCRYLKIVERALRLIKDHKLIMMRQYYFCPMALPEDFKRIPRFYYKKELSGGLVVDQAIHFLDLVRYVTASEAAEIQAFGNNLQHPKEPEFSSDETVTINLRMKNQVVVSHTHTWAYPKWQSEVELIAVGAHLRINLFAGSFKGEVDGVQVEYSKEDNGYLTELQAIVQAAREKSMAPIRSDFPDAVKSFAVTLAINRSLESGERLVPES